MTPQYVELVLQDFAEKAVKYAQKSGVQYCDARAEQYEEKSVLIEKQANRTCQNKQRQGNRNQNYQKWGMELLLCYKPPNV